jgi:hypothetical protein
MPVRNRLNRYFGTGIARQGVAQQDRTNITELGRPDYARALKDWDRVYGAVEAGVEPAKELSEQFAPGGGYGLGRRQETRDLIYGGVARDTATAIASGSSSISSARGLNTLGARELATEYGNIEDSRAQLQVQAFTPYTQMLSNLASVGTSRPTKSQYISTVTSKGKAPKITSYGK